MEPEFTFIASVGDVTRINAMSGGRTFSLEFVSHVATASGREIRNYTSWVGVGEEARDYYETKSELVADELLFKQMMQLGWTDDDREFAPSFSMMPFLSPPLLPLQASSSARNTVARRGTRTL
jgi:hypothetical protein